MKSEKLERATLSFRSIDGEKANRWKSQSFWLWSTKCSFGIVVHMYTSSGLDVGGFGDARCYLMDIPSVYLKVPVCFCDLFHGVNPAGILDLGDSNSAKSRVIICRIQESCTSIEEWFIIEPHLGWIKYGQYANRGSVRFYKTLYKENILFKVLW